jgi:hypothetical protein
MRTLSANSLVAIDCNITLAGLLEDCHIEHFHVGLLDLLYISGVSKSLEKTFNQRKDICI